MKCGICGEEINIDKQCFKMQFGKIKQDEFGGINFQEGTYLMDQFIHFKCYIDYYNNENKFNLKINLI